MPLLFRITIAYLAAGTLIVTLFRDNPMALLAGMAAKLPHSLQAFVGAGHYVLPIVVLLLAFVPRGELPRRLAQAIVAVFVAMAFFLTFTMIKSTLPLIVPFWADPMLAGLDRALFFGHDPWALAHAAAPWLDPGLATRIYVGWWAGPAMFLPVLLILTDRDPERVRRFTWLHAFTWIMLGNILALALMSAGPVYYDRLLGSTEFAGLAGALSASGVSASTTGYLQDFLWQAYSSGAQQAGSGISAFPSVHVGMVTVLALYVAERWRWLAPLSVAMVATFLFLSVYLGWHYAVDGAASIALVGAAWAWATRRGTAPTPIAAPPLADPVAAE